MASLRLLVQRRGAGAYMKSLVEWAFRFSVDTQKPITDRQLEELLSAATQWAEAHSHGSSSSVSVPRSTTSSSAKLRPRNCSTACGIGAWHVTSFLSGGFREYTEEEQASL